MLQTPVLRRRWRRGQDPVSASRISVQRAGQLQPEHPLRRCASPSVGLTLRRETHPPPSAAYLRRHKRKRRLRKLDKTPSVPTGRHRQITGNTGRVGRRLPDGLPLTDRPIGRGQVHGLPGRTTRPSQGQDQREAQREWVQGKPKNEHGSDRATNPRRQTSPCSLPRQWVRSVASSLVDSPVRNPERSQMSQTSGQPSGRCHGRRRTQPVVRNEEGRPEGSGEVPQGFLQLRRRLAHGSLPPGEIPKRRRTPQAGQQLLHQHAPDEDGQRMRCARRDREQTGLGRLAHDCGVHIAGSQFGKGPNPGDNLLVPMRPNIFPQPFNSPRRLGHHRPIVAQQYRPHPRSHWLPGRRPRPIAPLGHD